MSQIVMKILLHVLFAFFYFIMFGCIGFVLGFIGPMILAPSANQGPLLGFILGPLGCFIGLIFYIYKAISTKE